MNDREVSQPGHVKPNVKMSIECDESDCGRAAFYICQIHMIDACTSEDANPNGDHSMLLCSQCTAVLLQCAAQMLAQMWSHVCPDCLSKGIVPQCHTCDREIRELSDLVVASRLVQ